MKLLDIIPGGNGSSSPLLNNQWIPDLEIFLDLSIDEMEEECARLMRWHGSLLEEGKTQEAEELMLNIINLEDAIAEAEKELDDLGDNN